MRYWVVVDGEGAWLTTDRPSPHDEVVLETDDLHEAEVALCREISLGGA